MLGFTFTFQCVRLAAINGIMLLSSSITFLSICQHSRCGGVLDGCSSPLLVLMFTERTCRVKWYQEVFHFNRCGLVIDFCVKKCENIEYIRLYLTCQLQGRLPLCARVQFFFPNLTLRVINYYFMHRTAKSILCLFTCFVINWKPFSLNKLINFAVGGSFLFGFLILLLSCHIYW